tara:strand:- start:5471 stop:6439 length:969 start_codon:yes stop_codon:yes gene_type:complete
MNEDYDCLRDPDNGSNLYLTNNMLFSNTKKSFEIVDNIPRFVGKSNYSDDFGYQWKKFYKTQLDTYTGLNISEERLKNSLGFNLNQLKNRTVLEAGSGAGRFTEILLKYKSIVHSFDYSKAVEANAKNHKGKKNLTLVQADIRKIPFEKNFYDIVLCLGVLQHTPNPEESIKSLWKMVKSGGNLVFDHYKFQWRTFLPPPFGQALGIYRFLILRLPVTYRFKFVKKLVDFWFPIHWKYRNNYIMTKLLRRLSPVIFHYEYIKLKDRKMYYEWSLLDTHDSTTDYYRHLRNEKQIVRFIKNIGAIDIKVSNNGNGVLVSCKKI